MKIDPHKHQQKYENWKKKGIIPGVSKFNSGLIVAYLTDMEHGLNVARRGSVGYGRLNNLRQRMGWVTRELERLYKDRRLVDFTEREIVTFFKDMRDGRILTKKGKRYVSAPDYANVFKAFWHWYQRVEHDKENSVKDITRYIDTSPVQESSFVYVTLNDVQKMTDQAKYEYKVLMWFLFDSGIRSPTELMNIRVSDLSDGSDVFQLHIRDEISKTFGRKIKLLLCSSVLRPFIQKLDADSYVFPIVPRVVTQYLKRLAVRVLGDYKTKGGKYIREISMYDFRHASACYWLPRYKNESALKYRFGWKKDDMVHHYTKLLGMRDTIVEDDLLIDTEAKTRLEQELQRERKTRELLQEQLQAQRTEMDQFKEQLASSQSRDQLILKLLNGLSRNGKMEQVITTIKEEGLSEEVMRM